MIIMSIARQIFFESFFDGLYRPSASGRTDKGGRDTRTRKGCTSRPQAVVRKSAHFVAPLTTPPIRSAPWLQSRKASLSQTLGYASLGSSSERTGA